MAKEYTGRDFNVPATEDYTEETTTTEVAKVATDDCKLYSIDNLTTQLCKGERTVRTWLKAIKSTYHWLDETEMVSRQGKKHLYTSFTLDQLKNIKQHLETGESLENWVSDAMTPQQEPVSKSVPSLTTYNPHTIEVPPLPELPVLNAEIVQVDTPEILKQKSINDKLQDLIEVATARTHQQIEEANRV
ncbi:MAG: hypothetical protein WA865_00315, partial [Spirulinaceae cyanobacterium]